MGKKVFMTVGTTLFEKLIDVLEDEQLMEALSHKGYSCIVVQHGKGHAPDVNPHVLNKYNMTLKSYDYKLSISEDIETADLVISHAGAGTCIEVLNALKPLIVVVNESLMHNHQSELANQLTDDKHCVNCTPETLLETFLSLDESKLKPLPPAKPQLFVDCLDRFFGFT